MTQISRTLALALALAGVTAISGPAWAGGSQAYTNGSEDFGVGNLPPEGLHYIHYANYYNAKTFRDDEGNKIDEAPDALTFANTSRLLWISPYKILGGTYAAHVFVPIVYTENDFGSTSTFGRTPTPSSDDKFGLGNIIVSPFIVGWHGENVHAFLNLVDVFMPTRTEYDNDDTVNLGNDFWTFEPVLGVSYYPGDFELSAKFMYDFSTKDTDHRVTPDEANQLGNPGLAGQSRSRVPGQEFHFDYVAAYHPDDNWALGAVGYFYQQTTDDRISGDDVDDRKGRVLAMGPGVQYSHENLTLIGKAYFETLAENRNQGVSAFFKFIYKLY